MHSHGAQEATAEQQAATLSLMHTNMAVSLLWTVLFGGVLVIRALLFGAYVRASDFLETTNIDTHTVIQT